MTATTQYKRKYGRIKSILFLLLLFPPKKRGENLFLFMESNQKPRDYRKSARVSGGEENLFFWRTVLDGTAQWVFGFWVWKEGKERKKR